MQIQLTITEEFGDVVSFAEFAQALQAFLAGRSHRVTIGKTEASPAAVAAARTFGKLPDQTKDIRPEEAFDAIADAIASGCEPPAPAATEAPADDKPKRRGRPPKSEAKAETPAASPAPAEPDPFAADVAAAEVAMAAAPARAMTFDEFRPRVLKFMELRPDRMEAGAEWRAALKANGYESVADVTNTRAGETEPEKAARIKTMADVLEGMIAKAEDAAAAAKAAKAK